MFCDMEKTQDDDNKKPGPTIVKVLTPRCFQAIFAYLTINDLIRSERISRDWQEQVLQYLPSVQNYRISFPNSACRVPDRCIAFRTITLSMRKGEFNKMIHKMGKYFVRVYSDCIDEEDSKTLTVHCPQLEYLLLSGTHVDLMFNDEIESELTDESLPKKKLTGTFLKDLTVDLKTLGLSFFKKFKLDYLESVVHRLTCLTRLDLNFNSTQTLRSVSLLLEKLPFLEQLSLMEYEQNGEPGIDPPCFDRLPRLRELHLWGNDFVADCWVEAAASCDSLRVLNVGTCFEVTMRSVVALCQKRCELIELVVSKLRVTDEDLEACVRSCKDLELLDASWCSWLTTNVLTRLSRPTTRPLVLRLRGTKLPKDIFYEGLILRFDLTPELYNPLHVRYDRGPPDYFSLYDSASPTHCDHGSVRSRSPHGPNPSDHGVGAKDVVLAENVIPAERHAEDVPAEDVPAENAIVMDLPDVHAEDAIRAADAMHAEYAVHAEDNIRAEDAILAEEAILAEDGIPAEDAMQAEEGIPAEDAMQAEDGIPAEDAMQAEDGIPAEDAMLADDNIRVEAAVDAEGDIHAEGGVRAEGDVRAEDVMRAEDVRRAQVDLYLPIERRVEDAMHAENDIRAEDAIHAEDDRRAGALRAQVDLLLALNEQVDLLLPDERRARENGIHAEDAMHAEDDIRGDAAIRPEGDIHGEANNRARNGIRPVIVIHGQNIRRENALHVRDDLRGENNVELERIPRENLMRAIAMVHEEDDDDVILENGIHPEDDILPEDDIFPDNDNMFPVNNVFPYVRVEEDRFHVEEIIPAPDMFDDGLFPDGEDQVFIIHEADDRPAQNGDHERDRRVLNRMFEDYGVDQGNGMPDEHDIFADDILFVHDDILMEDDDDDVD